MEYSDKDDYVNPFTDDFGNFESDVDEDIEKFSRDTYDWVENGLPEQWMREGWERLHLIRIIMNDVLLGIPFLIFMATAIGWNLWANIVFNNWWA